MDKMQPLEVFGNDLASLKMNLGQKEQKFSKKAENGFLALILSNDSKMSSYFVRNDNFCMQKPWEAQIKKKKFLRKKRLTFLVHALLNDMHSFEYLLMGVWCLLVYSYSIVYWFQFSVRIHSDLSEFAVSTVSTHNWDHSLPWLGL